MPTKENIYASQQIIVSDRCCVQYGESLALDDVTFSVTKGKKIAVVGSGPAGLACADQLNKNGYQVTVYEKDEKIGGLLRFGIPDFKLEKKIIDRRVKILEEEGVNFLTKMCIGENISIERLDSEYDAVVLCVGSTVPKDIVLEGRNLSGIHLSLIHISEPTRPY